MSPRAAVIVIAVFAIGAVIACALLMPGFGAEFAIVGLAIAVFCAALGIMWPAMAGRKKQP